jgi:hypothetical protein
MYWSTQWVDPDVFARSAGYAWLQGFVTDKENAACSEGSDAPLLQAVFVIPSGNRLVP